MDCSEFKKLGRGRPSKKSKCGNCGEIWAKHHITILAEESPKPNPRIRGTNEHLLNEIVNLIYPNGKSIKSSDELTLRLHLVVDLLRKYGFGPRE